VTSAAGTKAARPGPRERLLRAALDMTYAHGVNVGVDAILKEADVARRSLYQHFGGKDGLITEALRTSAAEYSALYERVLDSGGDDPRARIRALFDELAVRTRRPNFHGCRFTAADLALTDPDHPAHEVGRAHKRHVRDLLHRELERMDHPDPEGGADQLLLLVDATLVIAGARPGEDPVVAARGLAEMVLARAPATPPGGAGTP
jgi:AcrR family transcriptional regulator